MKEIASVPGSIRKKLEFEYDWQGRRVKKTVWRWNTGWTYTYDEADRRYVYDGWNLLAEVNQQNTTLRLGYLWGLDLSGTMHGAGGVGGLLGIKSGTPTAFCVYDGNGNVTALVDAETGALNTWYEYGPFGEQIRMEGYWVNGLYPRANPFTFSTKFRDIESGMCYYGYRYNNPNTGKWLSRDPIDEKGGKNLYALAENDPIDRRDALGQISEGGVWPEPKDSVTPPTGPFTKCEIALRCGSVIRSGITLGHHCGLIIDTGSGVYAWDGSGGTVNSRFLVPAKTSDATGAFKSFPSSACECVFSNIKPRNDRKVPRSNLGANSNWNLKCNLTKCDITPDWSGQPYPDGYNAGEVIGAPKCSKFIPLPCPDQ